MPISKYEILVCFQNPGNQHLESIGMNGIASSMESTYTFKEKSMASNGIKPSNP